jgi:hypothetical protein
MLPTGRTGIDRRRVMEPLLIILVPGVFGGLVLALLIASIRWGAPSIVVPRRLAAPSYALINMAHIRVEGLGGLGMVAAVIAVAVTDPRIRLAMIVAAVLGTGLALALITIRRRTGPLPSKGDGPGITDDRSMLHLDDERRRAHVARLRGTIDRLERAGAMRFLPSA